ncbi:glycosyltransferase [Haoranjiania flava]|uniref:Glycosyltransferase n=1 Tax=Haoranjiania flava TaxID=1856322 RepID=A0AAE3IM60_9BACT|nr:glycosyltransferase [Haoranjiania flava]MCU7694443.1 glycosyltransferase [Haoranjiania flava]
MNSIDLITGHWREILFGSFCLVILIQLYYYIFIFSRLAFYKEKPKDYTQNNPLTVIICAKDEAANLVDNLPGVLVQNYNSTHSVLVVNDNSTDESKYILEELQRTFRQLQVLPLTQSSSNIPGKKFPLSMGIMSAKTELLLLTDADCIPASEFWMQKMQAAFTEEKDIVLGYGPYKKRRGLLNKLIRFETFHTALQYFSYALAGKPYMGVGRNLAYKKTVFLNNKGFSSINHIPGGDDDLFISNVANKRNTAVVLDKDTFTLSEAKLTWKSWRKQKSRHYTTGKYYKPGIKFLLGMYSLSAFLVYPLLVLAAVYYNVWLALGVYALRMIFVAVTWRKVMHTLDEMDLWKWFLALDIWQFIYYFIFASTLFKKPARNWK